MTYPRFVTLFALVGLAVGLQACRSLLPGRGGEPVPAVLALARPEVVGDLYRRWERAHEARGADRALRIPLRFAKGLSVEPTLASAQIDLDAASGRVTVAVQGLATDAALDVWLVDNKAGAGRTAMPEIGDGRIKVGTLQPARGAARLEVELGPGPFLSFEVDRAVIAPAGADPAQGLLFGSPSAFERLYARAQAGRLAHRVEEELNQLVVRGAELFEREAFDGNGRTCTTCHPAANNLTIDAAFIATLPADDSLFVAEQVAALAELENSALLRARGLILENLDGFDRPGVLRSVPHTLALSTSVTGPAIPFDNTLNPKFGISPPAERTGWSGDGAPGSGSLRDFATGAVVQHFPRTLERMPGRDFRLPTDEELDALEVFQLALGRASDPDLGLLRFRNAVVAQGAEIFNRIDSERGTLAAGKCALCHSNAGANVDPGFFTAIIGAPITGNANFGTGVNDLAAVPSELLDPDGTPHDGGFARVAHDGKNCTPPRGGFGTVTPEGGALPAGLCEEDFNTPPIVEAADTPPFFHNNAVDSIEAAVAFYNDRAFNESPGGSLLASLDSGQIGIRLDVTESSAVGSFLRVVNALENIRSADELARAALGRRTPLAEQRLRQVPEELDDAIDVLAAAGLHPDAIAALRRAQALIAKAGGRYVWSKRDRHIRDALAELAHARAALVEPA